MVSKKISDMTLKNTVASTDVLTILDSEDNYENKKILASSISGGGGLSHIHEIGNVTGSITGTTLALSTTDTVSMVNNDLYMFVIPVTNNVNLSSRTISINGTTYYMNSVTAPMVSSNKGLYTQGDIHIYRFESPDTLMLVFSSLRSSYFQPVSSTDFYTSKNIIPYGTVNLGGSSNQYSKGYFENLYVTSSNVPVVQSVVTNSSATPSITVASNTVYKFTNALTSLTISSIPNDTFESELQFTTGTGFTFTEGPLVNKWLGVATPSFTDGESYVIVIKNGYAVYSKVGA